MKPPIIHTGPLPQERAAIVEAVVQDIIARHTGINGFLLTGSIWSPETQLPHSDIDVNWHGTKNDNIRDSRLDTHSIFQVSGVTIELANYFWGNLSQPETMRLPVIVSLNRAHILWERDGVFSVPQRRTKELLQDETWVQAAIDRALTDLKSLAANWLNPVYCMENKDKHDGFDFVRTVVGPTVGLLDSIDLRPPSAARKGMMDITQVSAVCGITPIRDRLVQCLGAETMTAAEVETWNEQLAKLYAKAAELRPDMQLVKRDYHIEGVRIMNGMGYSQECVWPLWRGFADCMQLLEGVDAGGREAFEQFARRLQLFTFEDIARRTPVYAEIVDSLYGERNRLTEHLLNRASAWR